jgi:hypothetical protein
MENKSRREMAMLATGGLAAAALLAVSTTPAAAYQGNMERALSALYDALASLREATPDKGGHRGTAMGLINNAIQEVQAGIEWASDHNGD